jgi:lipopolysaccharide export system protein LptC
MKTDKAVSFVTENLEVTAIGMQANNQTQQIHLDSKVRIRLAQNASGSRHSNLN